MSENNSNKFPTLSLLIGIIVIAILVGINYFMYWAFDITTKGTHYTARGLLIFNTVVITWFSLRFLSILIRYLYGLKKKYPPELLVALLNTLILFFALAFIVTVVLGMPLWSLTALGGFIGAGIGFSLREPILDFFMGLMLDNEKTTEVGQWIGIPKKVIGSSSGAIGKVVARNWRTTTLLTGDRNHITIPNHLFSERPITHYNFTDDFMVKKLTIQLDYNVPVERAQRLITGCLINISEVSKWGGCTLLANDVSKGGIEYILSYPVHDLSQAGVVRHKIIDKLIATLKDYNLKISDNLGVQGSYNVKEKTEVPLLTFKEIAKTIDLFSALTEAELETLSANVMPLNYQKGDVIVKQRDSGDSMFIIGEGAVEVYQEMAKKKGEETPKEEFLAYLGPFDYFGDMALLTGEKRTASVRAATDLIAFEVTKAQMLPFLQARPQMAQTLSHIVTKRKMDTELTHIKDKKEREKQQRSLSDQISEAIRNYFKITL